MDDKYWSEAKPSDVEKSIKEALEKYREHSNLYRYKPVPILIDEDTRRLILKLTGL